MADGWAGAVLAAGRSTRFGAEDKLAAGLNGRPLASHAAAALAAVPLAARAAVCPAGRAGLFPGFVRLEAPEGSEQSASLAAAARWAAGQGAAGLLVVLGDMPFVTAADLAAVLAAAQAGGGAACVTDGSRRMPPAAFAAALFPALAAAEGDQGARAILRGLGPGQLVGLPAERLRDIDTVGDLAAAQRG
ncbi:NTP transferase domain-containing protein [Mangrovicoccus sp. HB161399]|uniref:NTP transferase domain-containing protein n=1 Tax=Mangrovicoccus sp. HB161399 TaxID=2720392 RepID=UPI0015562AE2|nr:NTP transferase domain-containing protein [Mangrovicoccus sp. HB161399]